YSTWKYNKHQEALMLNVKQCEIFAIEILLKVISSCSNSIDFKALRVAGTNSVPANLNTPHHHRHNLLVTEEGSFHRRLYSLHCLQHLHHTLLFRINPHRGLHYPRPSLRINLHLQYLRHHPLHLPTHLRHLH
ncbi:hypothetical protein HN51_065247, partial [Arachis hypogaea]